MSSSEAFRIAVVSAVLMVVCIAGLVLVLWTRRWVKDEGKPIKASMGFTLSDLRELHRAGQLSTEEFERAKEKIVSAARRHMLATPPAVADRKADSADSAPVNPTLPGKFGPSVPPAAEDENSAQPGDPGEP